MKSNQGYAALVASIVICAALTACGDGQVQDRNTSNIATRSSVQNSATPVAADYLPLLQRIYVAYFGRPADPAGLAFFANAYAQAGAPTEVAGMYDAYNAKPEIRILVDNFGTSAESSSLYPGSNRDFVNAIYRNLFNRDADTGGLDFWAGNIDKGAMTRGVAALAIMAGAGPADRAIIDAKIQAAELFTQSLNTPLAAGSYSGAGASASARSLLARVGSGNDSGGAQALVDATISQLTAAVDKPGIYLVAGSTGGAGTIDGTGDQARFGIAEVGGIAFDESDNIYLTDHGSGTVRRVTPSGSVTTIAGVGNDARSVDGNRSTARLSQPSGIVRDAAGNLYVTEWNTHRIRKIDVAGNVSTLAGSSRGAVDGQGAAARFFSPWAIAIDQGGNLLVSEAGNFALRKITPEGIVSTYAGSKTEQGYVDGSAANARFGQVRGLVFGRDGALFVNDKGNAAIRRIDSAGMVSTVVKGITGNSLALDADGNLLVIGGAHGIKRISGVNGNNPGVTLLTGVESGDFGYRTQRDGAFGVAELGNAVALGVAKSGLVYFADTHTVRVMDRSGAVRTLAGRTWRFGRADGAGRNAVFYYLLAAAKDKFGTLHVLSGSDLVKVSAGGFATTLPVRRMAPESIDGQDVSTMLVSADALALDQFGNAYISEAFSRIVKRTPSGDLQPFAGKLLELDKLDGVGAQARFENIVDLKLDAQGNVFVLEQYYGYAPGIGLRKVTPAGVVSTIILDAPGRTEGFVLDAGGNAYYADSTGHVIRKISAQGVVSIVAGSGVAAYQDGPAASAQFHTPQLLGGDPDGNLYVLGREGVLRKIDQAGQVSSIAGTAFQIGDAESQPLPGTLPAGAQLQWMGPKQLVLASPVGIFKIVLP